jgi:heavy metal efflux system protein
MKNLFLLIFLFTGLGLNAQTKKPISLSEAMNLAVSNNHGLKASYQQVEIAKGNYKENFFLPSPWINAEFKEVPSGESLSSSQERSFGIQQQIEFPLRYPYKIKALKAGVSSAEFGYKQDELSLKAQTRNSYISWLGTVSLLQLAQENLKLAEEFSASSAKLNEAGEIGAIPLSQAKLGVSQAKLQLNTATNNEIKARADLLTLLGLTNDITLEPTDSLTSIAVVNVLPLTFDTLNQVSLQYSNSLVGQSKANLAYQRSAWLPDLSVEYMRQRIDGNNGFYGIGVGISVPLWFFNQQGAVQRTRAAYLQNLESYEQTRLAVTNQWKVIQNTIAQYQANIDEYKTMATESTVLVSNAKKAYEAGELSYLELIAAQQQYIQAKNTYLDNLLNYQLSLTDYYSIIGGM